MADLPAFRVTTDIRPFSVCGIDCAGPFSLRESKRRGNLPISKAYVAVFVCFKTKAVHLELVSSLSTEDFMSAFRRFCARRGTCAHVYSDNGTNLVGAANELKEIYEFLKMQESCIATRLATQNIKWHFISPRLPHFGGLWEAAVKSVKRHLRITMKDLIYTFKEYYTLLVEIEGILNSRPLTALSSDPNDLAPLTPAYFLIGDALIMPVEKDLLNIKDTHLSRWQHIQKLRQHYWQRWQKEYLQQLQARTKWKEGDDVVWVGDLVLLIEDNLPPLQWKLGRIEALHPGDDKVIRVVTVRTSTGSYKRAVKKICALPCKN
ncbi:uncharacterized protein [Mycetomoellerius zeteki]|uniref:uncharacterized protein n=1 Tax=Mycetomoellerius zeteki TaxID=64791 RepID=UPI00084E8510|nr:PREDICTED: uncharacterized protein LOC108731075 [Trachymyrmex zeteki]